MVKTTQYHAVEAYKVLAKYSKENFENRSVILKLFHVKKALLEFWEFQVEQDQAILKACNGVADNYGNVSFPEDTEDGANMNKFKSMEADLKATEVEVDVEPVELKLYDVPKLTIEDMEALEGFVSFIE